MDQTEIEMVDAGSEQERPRTVVERMALVSLGVQHFSRFEVHTPLFRFALKSNMNDTVLGETAAQSSRFISTS